MSLFWFPELTYFEKFIINVMKCGLVSKHLAIIIDGNRRYASLNGLPSIFGHKKGFDQMVKAFTICRHLGIKEVTFYMFSIDNFKRTKDKVKEFFEFLSEKYDLILEEMNKFMSEEICVRFIGHTSLLPKKMQKTIVQAMTTTKNNKRCYLNLALAYTSWDEIVNYSARTIVDGVKNGLISVNDIDENLLEDCLYTTYNVDLFIRSAGDSRFSNFLLWQVSKSHICFIQTLWPSFEFMHCMYCILEYQRICKRLVKSETRGERSERVEKFLQNEDEKRFAQLQKNL